MTARLEATLYGTSEASMADAVTITITEPGPIVYAAVLSAPARLSDALTAWQTLINAPPLVGTYALTWDTTAQAVTISAMGPVSFEVIFGGNLHSALGFSAATGHSGALTYTGDQQALARFDDLRFATPGVIPYEDVEMHEYRHGRHSAVAWSQVDVVEGRVYCTAERMAFLARSYCAAGAVRLYVDEGVAAVYSAAATDGYVDGMVLALDGIEHRPGRGLSSARLAIGLGRA